MQIVAGEESGSFTEDSSAWKSELQRNCEEVNVNFDETEEQEKGLCGKKKIDGRVAGIQVKMAENKVVAPDDTIVSEMIKQRPQGKSSNSQDASKNRLMVWEQEKVASTTKKDFQADAEDRRSQ